MAATTQQQLRYDWLEAIYGRGWLSFEEMLDGLRLKPIIYVDHDELKVQVALWESKNFVEKDTLLIGRKDVYKVTEVGKTAIDLYKKEEAQKDEIPRHETTGG